MADISTTSSARPHKFNGNDFGYWKSCMESYMCNLGMDVYFTVLDGYVFPTETVEGATVATVGVPRIDA
ncbi:hypothetical protein ACHQM5_025593 [Ranunculus cassubicifolius]